jgi:peroxiredoxin
MPEAVAELVLLFLFRRVRTGCGAGVKSTEDALTSENMSPASQRIGGAVPDFQLEQIGGGSQSLGGMLSGMRCAVVVFWSGVCSHCVRYDAFFNGFRQRHPEVAFAAVASRHGETPDQIRKVIAERALSFPILYDQGSVVAKQWATQQTPRAFLTDSTRTLLYRGAIDNFKLPEDPAYVPYLEPALDDFLAGRPVARADTASFGCAIQSVYYLLPKSL